ncbi:Bug family tripartite tricarboxylate transporter substrate binding protein [Aquabacterium sp.]|uniref:Bug family tripartite tricarboxylate transporter substrate binding protein n=1 Tax=Aquabacterium sp. TaxID=1872578 RepID=UPI002B61F64D|nr:Bug family tripartite tricarboxylate transporter substrate binding protein [Aquabacterium sp.]HSW03451.1 Bug family tripartite tricarboxylate transporter substrate binding protein [Aquabacterium sp.]
MTALHFPRRTLLRAGAAAGLLATVGLPRAQSGRTLRILVGFPPGGGTDAIARILAEALKDELGGATVIVENKPGAGGQLAAQALKAAAPDGSTLFLSHDHSISILPQVVKTPGFDPAHDFVPAAGFATFVNAFAVSGGTPAKSFNDYVAWLRGQGGKGAVGVPAPASVPEFLVKLIAEKYKLDLVAAPYRGSAPMMADMLGNQIAAGVGSIPDFIENHRAGKLRVVGVLGGARQLVMPEVPTFAELGLAGFEDVPYYGLFAPAGTPRAAIDGFSAALAKVLAKPAVHERLTAMGLSVGHMSPDQLGQRERAYTATWARIIKATGFVPQ